MIKLGYDGVNNSNEEFIAFYPEQIKLVSNIKPTKDLDINYSWKSEDGYIHLEADDMLSLDDFEKYMTQLIGRDKRIEAHLRKINQMIKDNVQHSQVNGHIF